MKVQPYRHSSAVILSGSVQKKNFPCQINKKKIKHIKFSPLPACEIRHMDVVNSLTLKSWTPMQANMKSKSIVTKTILPMVLMATNTHWTTC